MTRLLCAAVCALALMAVPSYAKSCNDGGICYASAVGSSRASYQSSDVTMLPHPEGCPRRAFCGCGAAVRVFGRPVRDLWPSCNWFDGRFPRDVARPGNVAGRCGHVFVLEHHISGKIWMVSDYNSGGRKSRLHPRSVAGLKIVNPNGRVASR